MTEKISREAQQKEVDLNYKAFTELSQEFYEENHGKYALMRGGKVVNLFDTWDDAAKTGDELRGKGRAFLYPKGRQQDGQHGGIHLCRCLGKAASLPTGRQAYR